MSTVEEAFCKILYDDAGVGTICANRIYPMAVPQDAAYPCITYSRVSGPRVRSLGGLSGLAHPRFQVNCWALTYKGAFDLEAAVKTALADYTGTVLSVVIEDISLEDDGDLIEPFPEYEAERKFGRRMDFIVWYRE